MYVPRRYAPGSSADSALGVWTLSVLVAQEERYPAVRSRALPSCAVPRLTPCPWLTNTKWRDSDWTESVKVKFCVCTHLKLFLHSRLTFSCTALLSTFAPVFVVSRATFSTYKQASRFCCKLTLTGCQLGVMMNQNPGLMVYILRFKVTSIWSKVSIFRIQV